MDQGEQTNDLNLKIFQRALEDLPNRIRYSANTLLKKLDPKITPEIGVFAIPLKGERISLTNTDGFKYKSNWFADIRHKVYDLSALYLNNLAPDVQGVLWQIKVEVVEAARNIIDKRSSNLTSIAYPTLPEFMHGHCIFLVLQVNKDALESHYCLAKNAIRLYPSQTSLIHETIAQFLDECLASLKTLSEGRAISPRLRDNGNEIIRQAGYWLMYTVGKATGDSPEENLFNTFNVVSAMRYESDEGVGRIIVSAQNNPNIIPIVRLINPISLRDHRGIRKMLEMSSDNIYLFCDSKGIYGLGRENEISYEKTSESLFIVEFLGHYHWELIHASNNIMVVEDGQPKLKTKPISKDEFQHKLLITHPQLGPDTLKHWWDLVEEASKQHHGTMLVITDHAESERKRLRNQSTPIHPIQLSRDLILPLTSIDGALLVNPAAKCYSVGTILDGMATREGNPGRGARYNSAIRYLNYAKREKHSCIIIAISEDGMINIFNSASEG